MLGDRNYMRSTPNGESYGNREANSVVWLLIAINIFVFLALGNAPGIYRSLVFSASTFSDWTWWQLVTSIFLHQGFGHLFFNMYGLYLFGTIVAPIMGIKRFLALYFISGITGNLIWYLFYMNTANAIVGASGALFGVMLACAMLRPNLQFMLLIPPIPIKMRTLVIVYAIIEIISQISNAQSGIAHLAHLGGLLGAYVYLKYLFGNNLQWDIISWKSTPKPRIINTYRSGASAPPRSGVVSSAELNRLLDKISAQGINSLTEDEMQTLRQAREQMTGKH